MLVTGCGNDDERLLELSRESLRRQAEQNEQMARQSQEVVEASRELVAADAEARREIVEVHHDIQSERQSLDRQHEDMESERREIATQRHRDPIVANALLSTGLTLAALLPLAVAWLLLRHQFQRSDDALLAEVLIAEITSSTPGNENSGSCSFRRAGTTLPTGRRGFRHCPNGSFTCTTGRGTRTPASGRSSSMPSTAVPAAGHS